MRDAVVLSPMVRMFAGTALTTVLTTGITAVLTGSLAAILGPERFGAYMLARRVVSITHAFTTLGMGSAIPRYVALARQEATQNAYLLAGLLLGILPGLVALGIGRVIPEAMTRLVYGNAQDQSLLLGSLCLLVGTSCSTVQYGFHRGLGRMGIANAWWLLVGGIGPAVIVYSPVINAGVGHLLLLMGLVGCTALLPLFTCAVVGARSRDTRSRLPGAVRNLFGYGVPRAPVGLAHQWLLALAPFLAFRHGGMAAAGFLLAGQIVFQIADLATNAFGVVVLPKVVVLHAEGRKEFLGQRITDAIAFVCHVGLFASLHLLVWSRPLLLTWLGKGYSQAVPVMQVLLTALIPYIAYVILRSIIDGIENRPINGVNLFFALLLTAVGSYLALVFGLGPAGLAAATAGGLWLLAAMSIAFLWKRYGLGTRELMLGWCVGVNVALLLPSVAMAALMQRHLSGGVLLAAGAVVEGLLFAVYCLLLWRRRARWATELMHRIVPGAC